MHIPYHQDIEFSPQQPFNLKRFERHLDKPWIIDNHFHSFCEIVIYESIEGKVRIDGQTLSIEQGQLLFIPPNTIHSFTVQPGQQIYHVLHVEPAGIHHLDPDYQIPTLPFVATLEPQDVNFLLSLIHWYEFGLHEKLKQNVFELIINVFFKNIVKVRADHRKRPSTFAVLIKYLNKNNTFSLSIDQAANICHLSRSHFMMKFKQTYGVTFNHFMQQRKIATAKYLLRYSDKNITEISHILEIDNTSYFIKLFKSEVGCSPKRFQLMGSTTTDEILQPKDIHGEHDSSGG